MRKEYSLYVKVYYKKDSYYCRKLYPVREKWWLVRKKFAKGFRTVVRAFPPLTADGLPHFLKVFERVNGCRVDKLEFYYDGTKISEAEYNRLVKQFVREISKCRPHYERNLISLWG